MSMMVSVALVGIGATLVIDLWAAVRKRLLGVPAPDYAMVGRWLAHMPHGRFRHAAIAKAEPVPGEGMLGWSAHYLIGIAFAALLALTTGSNWFLHPTLAPALLTGIATVAAPLLLMQPGMGAGIAARNTPNPARARLHSLLTHSLFGLGMYLTGWMLSHFPLEI